MRKRVVVEVGVTKKNDEENCIVFFVERVKVCSY